MTYNFTAMDVLNEVVRLSEEDPDFVYTTQPGREGVTSCGYTGLLPGTTEGRSCIVGQALQNLGVPRDELCHLVKRASAVLEGNLHVENDDRLNVFNIIDDVQHHQDIGHSWGESVSRAMYKENYV